MDVLKPEVYWIGNRCYRINPCPTNQSQYVSYSDGGAKLDDSPSTTNVQTHKPYVEADEFEDAPVNLDEANVELASQSIEVVKEDTGFKVVCSIPSSLFPHIIGSKGAVKKRIEVETRTRVYVPRQNEKGDIVIRGQFERDVRKGYRRVTDIALSARFKREATHFTCFPMNSPTVVQKAKEFMENVLKDCASSRGLEKSLFQVPEKLHLTIGIMVLLDERERSAAAEILSSMEQEIRQCLKGKDKLQVRMKGLEIMNDDPTQVDVLYAKCEPVGSTDDASTIQQISDLIAKKFAENGLGKESRGEKVKIHCTVINTRYRSDDTKPESAQENRRHDDSNRKRNNGYSARESFDARAVLQKYGDFEFGLVEISEVKIATRHTTANDGFYKCYTALPF